MSQYIASIQKHGKKEYGLKTFERILGKLCIFCNKNIILICTVFNEKKIRITFLTLNSLSLYFSRTLDISVQYIDLVNFRSVFIVLK